MTTTDNYGLNKPDYSDAADIAKLNENADIIDKELKEHTHDLSGDSIKGILPVTKGGTGATTAAGARGNLGLKAAAVKGVDSEVTEDSGDLPTSGAVYDAINKASAFSVIKALQNDFVVEFTVDSVKDGYVQLSVGEGIDFDVFIKLIGDSTYYVGTDGEVAVDADVSQFESTKNNLITESIYDSDGEEILDSSGNVIQSGTYESDVFFIDTTNNVITGAHIQNNSSSPTFTVGDVYTFNFGTGGWAVYLEELLNFLSKSEGGTVTGAVDFEGDVSFTGSISEDGEELSEKYAAIDHTHDLSGDSIKGILPVTKGGTGATTAAAARGNLGLGEAAVKGVDSEVTEDSGDLPTSGAVYDAINKATAFSVIKSLQNDFIVEFTVDSVKDGYVQLSVGEGIDFDVFVKLLGDSTYYVGTNGDVAVDADVSQFESTENNIITESIYDSDGEEILDSSGNVIQSGTYESDVFFIDTTDNVITGAHIQNNSSSPTFTVGDVYTFNFGTGGWTVYLEEFLNFLSKSEGGTVTGAVNFEGDVSFSGSISEDGEELSEKYAAIDHTHDLSGDSIKGILPVTKGGTGATTAAAARGNLGLGEAAVKGVDDEVVEDSGNLVTSGAVYDAIDKATVVKALQSDFILKFTVDSVKDGYVQLSVGEGIDFDVFVKLLGDSIYYVGTDGDIAVDADVSQFESTKNNLITESVYDSDGEEILDSSGNVIQSGTYESDVFFIDTTDNVITGAHIQNNSSSPTFTVGDVYTFNFGTGGWAVYLEELLDFLSKSEGGEVSGDVTVKGTLTAAGGLKLSGGDIISVIDDEESEYNGYVQAFLNNGFVVDNDIVFSGAGTVHLYRDPAGNMEAATKKYVDSAVKGSAEASIVIAASDTDSTLAAKADYICGGSNDETIIQEAIEALPAAGGKIVLLPGNYVIEDYIHIRHNYIWLCGCGTGTKLNGSESAGTAIYMEAADLRVSDMFLTDVRITTQNTDGNNDNLRLTIDNLTIRYSYNYAIIIYTDTVGGGTLADDVVRVSNVTTVCTDTSNATAAIYAMYRKCIFTGCIGYDSDGTSKQADCVNTDAATFAGCVGYDV